MSKSARSLFVFGLYCLLAGAAFLAVPAALLALLQWPSLPLGWARVIGLLALVIGAYNITGAQAECRAYIRASVFVRSGFAAGVALLVLMGQMPVTLLLLGAVDAAGAAWTAVALKWERLPAGP